MLARKKIQEHHAKAQSSQEMQINAARALRTRCDEPLSFFARKAAETQSFFLIPVGISCQPLLSVLLLFCIFFASFFSASLRLRDQLIFDANAHPANMKRSANWGLLYSCELCASA